MLMAQATPPPPPQEPVTVVAASQEAGRFDLALERLSTRTVAAMNPERALNAFGRTQDFMAIPLPTILEAIGRKGVRVTPRTMLTFVASDNYFTSAPASFFLDAKMAIALRDGAGPLGKSGGAPLTVFPSMQAGTTAGRPSVRVPSSYPAWWLWWTRVVVVGDPRAHVVWEEPGRTSVPLGVDTCRDTPRTLPPAPRGQTLEGHASPLSLAGLRACPLTTLLSGTTWRAGQPLLIKSMTGQTVSLPAALVGSAHLIVAAPGTKYPARLGGPAQVCTSRAELPCIPFVVSFGRGN